MHIPVLLQETIDGLSLQSGDTCIDATVGHGGHSEALLERIAPSGTLIGFDRDRTSLFLATERLKKFRDRFIPIHDSFAALQDHTETIEKYAPVRAIIADLGLSSLQLDEEKRGFSFRFHAPLDMRFDQTTGITAEDVIRSSSPEHLARILRDYGDEKHSMRIAKAFIDLREEKDRITTSDALACIEKILGKGRPGKSHPATRVFQALRIEVNNELEHITTFLPQAIDVLASGGRIAIITFHSIEDRLVKRFFKHHATECICPPEIPECRCDHHATIRIITRKAIVPTKTEITHNPRSRSAQLRIIQKL